MLTNRTKYNAYRREWASQNPKGVYRRIVASSARKGYPVVLTQPEFLDWYSRQPLVCTYCGVDDSHRDVWNENDHRALTIDRIESAKFYEVGNLALACALCNRIKSNFFTFDEMKVIAQMYVIPKRRN